MEITFSYGEKNITVDVPRDSLIDVLDVPFVQSLSDPREAIVGALSNPIGTPRLMELAKGRHRAAIMIPDRTRPAPLPIILPHILNEIEQGGISRDRVTLIIGLGTHRAMSHAEIENHVGRDVAQQVEIVNHAWWDPSQLANLGKTRNGTPICINKLVYEADLKIALGGVKPHRCAGWSGGAKMIQPGVSGQETTGATHWLSACYGVKEMLGRADNPVRREMEEIAGRVGLDFVVNYVLNGSYELVQICAGHYIKAHRECIKVARPIYTRRISELADIVLAGSSSVSTNMWANGTGPNSAELLIKPSATVVLFAPCPDGVAEEHPEVLQYGYRPFSEVKALVDGGFIKSKCAAAHLVHAGSKLHNKNAKCIIVSSGVRPEDAARLGLKHLYSAQAAVDAAFMRHGSTARVYVYPGNTFADFIIEGGQ